jgi:MFS family permease
MISRDRTIANTFFNSAYPWLICFVGMLFYCYNYFLRVSPSVMQNELSATFHITASQFGTLAAFYYYAYTPMQLPAGLIYDKFGVRFVLCFACLMAVVGLSLFITANSYIAAGMGRFLIGFGSAFAYIGVLKLASLWLPANRFATVAGLTTACGMLFGALSQKYLTKVIEAIGYKQALHSALIAGIILSGIIALLIRNQPKKENRIVKDPQSPMNSTQIFSALRIIITNPQMWLIGIIGCLLYLPASVFLDLWGIPYLESVYHLNASKAVNIANITFLGWIISGPIIGAFSDKIKRRKLPLIVCGMTAAFLLCTVFYVPDLKLSTLYLLFFIIGFSCGAHPLCFALGKESNPIQISGTAVATTNMLIMAGGAIFQPLVGFLLDMHTSNPIIDGLRTYAASDYTFALSVVPIGVVIGIVLSLFLKETYCNSQSPEEHKRIFRNKKPANTIPSNSIEMKA